MKYVIGLDIGTSSVKAVLFQQCGLVIAEQEIAYDTYYPKVGWAEQNPLEIESATIEVLSTLVKNSPVRSTQIEAIGLSSAMHSIICVDDNCNPLSPLITWADQRSAPQARKLKAKRDSTIYLKTGTPIHPMSPFIKLVWMYENEYEPYKKASKFLSIKEFIIARLFQKYVVDYAVASATGLFNVSTLQWEKEALQAAHITKDQLSKPQKPTYVCKGLPKEVAKKIGIRKSVPFVIGASDGPLANIGLGAMNAGDVTITIGTSGAIRQMSSAPQTDQKQEVFCYAVTNDRWVIGGPTNNGGNVFTWSKRVLGERERNRALKNNTSPYDELTKLASTSPTGANGLLFLPYLHGERAPLWDAEARGAFIGLNATHTKADMVRASLEGVLFNIYHISESLAQLAGKRKNILASGGFSRSSLWLQMLANIFGEKVRLPFNYQSSAWGAAWFALIAVGAESELSHIKQSIPMKEPIIPNEKAHETYQTLFPIYKKMSAQLQPSLSQLSTFQRKHT